MLVRLLRYVASGLVVVAVAIACSSGGSGAAAAGRGGGVAAACRTPPDPNRGYPVAVTLDSAPSIPTAYLNALALSLAQRWRVPITRPEVEAGWRQVRQRTVPPEPRWADDWRPRAQHRARLEATLSPDGRADVVVVTQPSGDPAFDQSLGTMFTNPLPSSPPLPPFPTELGDRPVRISVWFGRPAPAPSGIARFAVTQTAQRQLIARSTLAYSTGARALIKYDVSTRGRIVTSSYELLESSNQSFAFEVAREVQAAEFVPAQSNCRDILVTVVHAFGRYR